MGHLTHKQFAIQLKTKTENLKKAMDEYTSAVQSLLDDIDLPSITAETPSGSTPSQRLAMWKFERAEQEMGCLAMSPLELNEHLTASEMASLP